MLTLPDPGASVLAPLQVVVEDLRAACPELPPESIMLVGAHCRDVLHAALGHESPTSTTTDLDLALALSSWTTYETITTAFQPVGSNQIRYRIASMPVDLIAFGAVEAPTGTVTPPPRDEAMSVWAFEEIFAGSLPLALDGMTIRIPDPAGYTAAKLMAWLDRSAWGETRDARDIALALHWYAESPSVQQRLWETDRGNDLLVAESSDLSRSAARLLGEDVVAVIGPERSAELVTGGPGDQVLLTHHLINTTPTPWQQSRRDELVDALTRGLTIVR